MECLVIGVGNAFRRDDGAGIEVARRISALGLSGVRVLEESGEGAALMSAWADAQWAIVVDAMSSDAPPGSIHRFDPREGKLASGLFRYSSHAFSVAEAVELGRRLDRLPEHLILYGIEGDDFGYGPGLSALVARSVEEVVGRIVAELRGRLPARSSEIPKPRGDR